jgi:Periplasmic binding protein
VNALKQAVQFGLDKKFHLAGAQQELEVLIGLPPEARIGTWVFEWYWKQPNVPHVDQFVADIRKVSGGHVPTARTWFGYAAVWTCALAATQAKSLDAVKMARAMQGFKLPPEVALMPDGAFYRESQNQLIPNLYVGNAQSKGSDPERRRYRRHSRRHRLQDELAGLDFGKLELWPARVRPAYRSRLSANDQALLGGSAWNSRASGGLQLAFRESDRARAGRRGAVRAAKALRHVMALLRK